MNVEEMRCCEIFKWRFSRTDGGSSPGLTNGHNNHYPNRGGIGNQNNNVVNVAQRVNNIAFHRNPNMNPEMQQALQGFSLGLTNANLSAALLSSRNEYSKEGMSIIDESMLPAATLAAAKYLPKSVNNSIQPGDIVSFDNFTTLRSIEGTRRPTKDTRFISLGRRKLIHNYNPRKYIETNEYTEEGSLFKGKAITLPDAVLQNLHGHIFRKLDGTTVIFDPPIVQNGYYTIRILEDRPSRNTVKNKATPYARSAALQTTKSSKPPRGYGGTRHRKQSKRSKRSTRRR